MSDINQSERSIKTRVFIIYSLVALLIVFILYVTFSSFHRLTRSAEILARPNLRIELLHQAIKSIYYAESNIRSYTLGGGERNLNKYFDELSHINILVDSLYALSENDQYFRHHIDTINIHLVEKIHLLEQLLQVSRLDYESEYFDSALTRIISAAEQEVRVSEFRRTVVEVPEDEAFDEVSHQEVTRKKDGFFQRIRNLFAGRSQNRRQRDEQPVDTLQVQPMLSPVQSDTVITVFLDTLLLRAEIETTIQNLMQSLQLRQLQAQAIENQILLEDKRVMDRIWSHITILEEYETQKDINQAQQAEVSVGNTIRLIFLMVVVFVLALLVITWLFIKDINKSKYYKTQLISERNRAEELLRIKQRFLANVSHEIRTPLNSILGFSGRLEKSNLTNESGTFVRAIGQSSAHLLQIVNDILDFSKIDSESISLVHKPFDLILIAKEVYHTLLVLAQEKALEFNLELSQLQNRFVIGDPLRIKQIMLNISGNAIKFTSAGRVEITIGDSVSAQSPHISNIVIRISDTGSGIPPSEQRNIFEAFVQGDNRFTRKNTGTGLGLTIAKKLVEYMNGSIDLLSEPDSGTVFTVHLPLAISEPIEIEAGQPDKQFFENSPFEARILLADDDDLNRLLIKSILSQYDNIELCEAVDATEALIMMGRSKFDLIITDVQMPGISGPEMVKMMKSDPANINKDTPVLACTADITIRQSEIIEETGIADILMKPFYEKSLLQKIFSFIVKPEVEKEIATARTDKNQTSQIGRASCRETVYI